MALTTPDNIWTPDAGEQYALTTDLATTASSIQSALTHKANYGVGTTAQMNAAVNQFPDGAMWYNTTNSTEYRRVAGIWEVDADDTGWVNITGFATGFGPQSWGDVPAYRVWSDGKVECRGVIAGTMGETMDILTIPSTARPSRPKNMVAATNTSATSNGIMRIEFGPVSSQTALRVYPSGANRTWVSLDGLSYYLTSA